MSDDLPNQNNNPPNPEGVTPQTPSSPPNIPNNNPPPPNNTVDPVQSWIAQHEQRGEHGHFVKSDSPNTPNAASQTTPPNPSSPSSIPPIIEINQNTKPSDKKDPPLFGFFITNPNLF